MPSRAWLLPPIWLLLWSCLALFAIFQHGPMPLYSTRTLAVAWEMWNSGQFLVPHINGQPYSHKVPLLFWLIHAGWAVSGVGDIWPRVLQISIGAGWLTASAALARRVLVLRPAAASVPWLLIALVYPFLFGLQIMYETLLALWVVLALWAIHGRPRWGWFAVALGAGLLTKGPVMLLHIVFPLLLGPWWSEYARADRRGWYLRAGAAVGAGLFILLAWALPAGMAGGAAYRNELFYLQTAGRVVDSFDHARPLYWYLPMLLVLLFPWVAWPRLWHAAFAQRPRLDDDSRFLASWLLPTFGVFCLVSGKQVYYLLPLLPAAGMSLALILARAVPGTVLARRRWSAWPLALLLIALALMLLALSAGLIDAQRGSRWLSGIAASGGWFAAGFILLGAALLPGPHGRYEVERIATVTLSAAVLAQMLFAQSLFPNFDLRPAATRVALAQAAGRPVANLGGYAGQFHFLGRLTQPIDDIHSRDLPAWTQKHPHGMVVRYPARSDPRTSDRAEWIQPFRSRQLEIWDAGTLAETGRAAMPTGEDEAETADP